MRKTSHALTRATATRGILNERDENNRAIRGGRRKQKSRDNAFFSQMNAWSSFKLFFFSFTINCLVYSIRVTQRVRRGDFLFYGGWRVHNKIVQKIRKIEKKFDCSFVYASNTSVGINMCGYFRLVLHFSPIVFLYQKFHQGFFFIFLTLNAKIY